MNLDDVLSLATGYEKEQDLSEDRIVAQMDNIRHLIAFFREYPDYFIDFVKGPDSTFKFYFYQRIFLRIIMRHRYVYATFPRAYSKSFLSVLCLMIRCVLYPNSELFVTTGGKEQARSITLAKLDEICRLLPFFEQEINWERGKTRKTKDNVEYVFKNGSKINILKAGESSRGQRRTGGLMEECILIDGDILNEVIIPTTNVDRLLPDGTRHPEEVTNKSQIYITTAGWKNSFAYDKLIELLIQSIIEPDMVMIMGGTYQTPVTEGLLNEDFVTQLELQGTFNEESFDREYRSIWSGDRQNAFYSAEKFDKHRVLNQAEYEFSKRNNKSAYYVLGVDVGRIGCTTEVCVFKVMPQPTGTALKSLVNLYSYEAEDFEAQAVHLKKLFYKYRAKIIAIDANGLGVGLIDFMTKAQIDPETGDTLIPFGVAGGTSDDAAENYKKIKGSDVENDAMWLIKANAPINTEAYSYAQSQMSSGRVQFLVDEQTAKNKIMETKVGQEMSTDQRNQRLIPFVLTTGLKAQMLNLVESNEGVNIILKQDSRSIPKDRFSAFIYGMLYIKRDEERRRKRRSRNIEDFLFFG